MEADRFLSVAGTDEDNHFAASYDDHQFSSDPFYYLPPRQSFRSGFFLRVPLIIGYNSEDGLMFATKYITNATKLKELNSNWDVVGTQEIFKFCCDFTKTQVIKARQIRLVQTLYKCREESWGEKRKKGGRRERQ